MSISCSSPHSGAEHRQRGLEVDARVAGAHGQRVRLGRRQAGLERAVHEQAPDLLEAAPGRRGPRCRRRDSGAPRPPCRARRSRSRRRLRPRGPTGASMTSATGGREYLPRCPRFASRTPDDAPAVAAADRRVSRLVGLRRALRREPRPQRSPGCWPTTAPSSCWPSRPASRSACASCATASASGWSRGLPARGPVRARGGARDRPGHGLVAAAVERARERGCGRVELDTNEGNAAARRSTSPSASPPGRRRPAAQPADAPQALTGSPTAIRPPRTMSARRPPRCTRPRSTPGLSELLEVVTRARRGGGRRIPPRPP